MPTSHGVRARRPLYVSSRFEGAVYRCRRSTTATPFVDRARRGVWAGVRRGRDALRRRPLGHPLRGRRDGQAAVCDAAAERRGVSSRDEPDGRALRERADAGVVRPDLSHRRATATCGRYRDTVRPAAGARVLPPARCTWSTRSPVRAASTGSPIRRAHPELVARAARSSAWRSARRRARRGVQRHRVWLPFTAAAAQWSTRIARSMRSTLFRRKPIADARHDEARAVAEARARAPAI